VVSKLVAGREKDHLFATARLRVGVIDAATLAERIELLDNPHPLVLKRLRDWIGPYL
jgi:hypothetical protein